MGLQLATAMSKLMRPSETAEMVLFGFLCLLLLYAARVVYLAPKTMPPKWKRYEEEKRQRKLYEDYERRQREGLARRRAPTQTPGSQTSAPAQYISTCSLLWQQAAWGTLLCFITHEPFVVCCAEL